MDRAASPRRPSAGSGFPLIELVVVVAIIVVSRLASAGYESILIVAPDGTTLVSGRLDGIVIGSLGAAGT